MKSLRSHSLYGNLFLTAVSLALSLLIIEAFLRLFSPQQIGPVQFYIDAELGPIPVPNQHARRMLPGNYDYTYSNNSLGLRGTTEYLAQKTKPRTLMLGDSFTYGIGVNDDQTFSYLLQQSRPEVEVINAGNGGRGTDYELKFYELRGSNFRPDLVILSFCPNDFDDNSLGYYYQVNGEQLTPKPIAENPVFKKPLATRLPFYNWLISWSHTANLIKATILRQKFGGRDAFRNDDNQTCSDPDNIKLTHIYMKHLIEDIRRDGARFVIYYIPAKLHVQRYRERREISEDERIIGEMAREFGVEFYSDTIALAASPLSLDRLYYDEGHWTAAGHRVVADYMLKTSGI